MLATVPAAAASGFSLTIGLEMSGWANGLLTACAVETVCFCLNVRVAPILRLYSLFTARETSGIVGEVSTVICIGFLGGSFTLRTLSVLAFSSVLALAAGKVSCSSALLLLLKSELIAAMVTFVFGCLGWEQRQATVI